MIALRSFVEGQIYMIKKKPDKRQILSNDENRAFINNLHDQIDFLKNELRSKNTIIKLIIENPKCNNQYFQNKNNDSNKLKNSYHQKNLSDNKDLNNFAFFNRFTVL